MLDKLNPTFKFIFWFSLSLVGILLLLSLISNKFTISLVLALIIGFLAVKD